MIVDAEGYGLVNAIESLLRGRRGRRDQARAHGVGARDLDPPGAQHAPRPASSCAACAPRCADTAAGAAWRSARRAPTRSRCGRTSASSRARATASWSTALRFVARQELIFGMHVHVGRRRPRQGDPRGQRHARAPAGAAGAERQLALLARRRHRACSRRRTPIFRTFPRVGIPPHYRDWADYESEIAFMVESGVMEDYTWLWYDVRPHPKFGTVEVRVCDSQTRVEHTLGARGARPGDGQGALRALRGRAAARRLPVADARREQVAGRPARARRRARRPALAASASPPRRWRGGCSTACASTPRTSARPPSSRRSTTCWSAATAPSASWSSTRPTTTCARSWPRSWRRRRPTSASSPSGGSGSRPRAACRLSLLPSLWRACSVP